MISTSTENPGVKVKEWVEDHPSQMNLKRADPGFGGGIVICMAPVGSTGGAMRYHQVSAFGMYGMDPRDVDRFSTAAHLHNRRK